MTIVLTDLVWIGGAATAFCGTLMMSGAQGTIDFTREDDRRQAAYRERKIGAMVSLGGLATALIVFAVTRMPPITFRLLP